MATGSSAGSDYVLGSSEREQERLLKQAAILRGWTERFFRSAGLRPGMRVLDVGCGMGDVSFLAAAMVSPGGSVVAIDHDPAVLQRAGERAVQQPHGQCVSFLNSSLSEFRNDQPFDAVVGRLVLLHQPDPALALRQAAVHVQPGGIVIFHEMDFDHVFPMWPALPLFERTRFLVAEVFRRTGYHPDLGRRLVRTFLDAGLPWPTVQAELPVGGDSGSYLYGWLADVVRTLLPRMEQIGLTTSDELQIDTLAARLEAEAKSSGTQVIGPAQFGAWVSKP
ncbi:MAG: class I SAM-dependent methyltransferase [Bryobacteraceae bacterium]